MDDTQAQLQDFRFGTVTEIPGTPNADAEAPKVVRSGNNLFVLRHEFPPGFDPNNPQPDVYLARSTNQGRTFEDPSINLSGSSTVFSGDEDIAVSGNRVYVVWIEGGDVVFRRDRENDGQFGNRVTLSDSTTSSNPTNSRVVASGDNVFVTWKATVAPLETDIFFTYSTDAGSNFKTPKNISTTKDDPSRKRAKARDPHMALIANNKVIVAWRQNPIEGTPPDEQPAEIFYAIGPIEIEQ